MNSHRVRIVGVVVCTAISSAAFAQNALVSLRPIGSSASTQLPLTFPLTRLDMARSTQGGAPVNFFDDFSTYIPTDYTNVPDSLVSLLGQVHPMGMAWGSSDPWFGAATLAIMQAAGAMHPVGDSPAFGPIANFAAAARKTAGDLYNPGFTELASYLLSPVIAFAPQIGSPVVAAQDIYLSSVDDQPRTDLWWSPVSFTEGFVLDRVFYGGTNIVGALAFAQNSDGVLDRFMSLGTLPGDPTIGAFFASAQHPNFPPPVNEWFTIMFNFSEDANGLLGYSLWIKTQGAVASNPPFLDPRMAIGDIPAVDNNPIGWVNTYPGFPDDPATPDVIEGIGLGANEFGDRAPTTGSFNQAPPLSALSFDGIQYGTGLDDPDDPTFAADDYFFANFRAHGVTAPHPPPPPPPPPPCTTDLTDDGVVDGVDLAVLLVVWGASYAPADFNGDGVVNGADLAILLTNWGPCPT